MAFERPGGRVLDYQMCRYGKSRLLVRGPKQRLTPPYTLFFGGTETFGRFVARPFPDLIASRVGLKTVNMGCVNAGLDAFASDPSLLTAAARSETTVIQVVGAHNLTNRFYTVHPRRNDRFITATPLLRNLYPEVDFTEFSFTRHMLTALETVSPERLQTVATELQDVWLQRMKLILREAGPSCVLLWLADAVPPQSALSILDGADPLFVDVPMMAQVGAMADVLVEAIPSRPAREAGTDGMVFTEFETPTARETAGPAVHDEVASHLIPVLDRLRRKGAA
ncbi:MAG: DUF6473 family protein [Pseudomonadota bacterium]